MKKLSNLALPLCMALFSFFFSCKQESDAWQKFMACQDYPCLPEVVAVKDAFLKDPKPLFEEFIKTDERGEDTYIGWIYTLRDSVINNPNYAPEADRTAMKTAVLAKAKEFEKDPKYGDWANSIIQEISGTANATDPSAEGGSDMGVTGTYSYELPNDGGSGEIQILDNGDNTLRFSLSVVGPGPAYNQGMMEGTATYADFTATINTTEYGGKCTIQLDFAPDQLVAKTLAGDNAACGFGNNVRADGTYKLTDDLNPFPAVAGDELPANMEGEWVSTTDSKSEISIFNKQYSEIYEGKLVSKMPFSYHKICPADCNPIAQTPCIKVYGQDNICYTVVKADGKTLELSMIGGTGNTLVYKAKG